MEEQRSRKRGDTQEHDEARGKIVALFGTRRAVIDFVVIAIAAVIAFLEQRVKTALQVMEQHGRQVAAHLF